MDVTDGTTGWMAAGEVDNNGKFIDDYLKYKSDEQNALHDFATTTPALKGWTGRLSMLIEAVDNYYNNTSTADTLKSSDNGSNNISLLKKSNFPEDLIIAIAKAESNIINLDNEWVIYDLGHGIMQVTDQNAIGAGSDIHIPSCEPPNDRYLCYGMPYLASVLDNSVKIGEWPKRDYNHYKYYENTAQAVYGNVKDGMRVLRQKYQSVKNAKGGVFGNLTYTDEDMKNISATYRYNQGSPYKVQAVYMVYDGVKTLQQIQDELISHGASPSWVKNTITSDWKVKVETACKDDTDFSGCLKDTDMAGLTTSALYLSNVAKRLNSTNPVLADKMATANTFTVTLWLRSPAELHVTDSSGNVTGVVSGIPQENVPNSVYDRESGFTALFFPASDTKYDVRGTATGTYGLVITNMMSSTTVALTDIPTTENTTQILTIDWNALANGEKGVTMQIDTNSDGIPEKTIKFGAKLTGDEYRLLTETIVDIDPDTLNRKNTNGVITAYIELPQGFDVYTIDSGSITLNGRKILSKPISIGDYNNNSIPDSMVKFDRGTIISTVPSEGATTTMMIEGKISHAGKMLSFEGEDIIKMTH